MSRSFGNFVASLSFMSVLTCGFMTLLAAGVGVQVYIPAIPLPGGGTLPVDLIQLGYAAFLFYASIQVAQSVFVADPGFEKLAKIGSWIALFLFAATLALMVVQLGINRGNLQEIMRTSSPFQLVLMLIAFALIDVTLLQMLKNHMLRLHADGHDAGHDDAHHDHGHDDDHDAHRVEVLPRGPAAVRSGGLTLVGHSDSTVIYHIDARGAALDLDFQDGEPRRLHLDAIPAPSHA